MDAKIPFMRRLWNEFKSFAMSGSMIDLALGFIIGAAFAKIIDSLAQNVLMQLIAAIFGKPDFTALFVTVNGGKIQYGQFLTDLVSFLIMASLLFAVVKTMIFIGIGKGRIFSTQDCPYCREQIGDKALVCRHCGHALVDELPPLAQAKALMEEQNRRRLALPIPARRRDGDVIDERR